MKKILIGVFVLLIVHVLDALLGINYTGISPVIRIIHDVIWMIAGGVIYTYQKPSA